MERGLIIKKEWLDKIFNSGKLWEMRSRPTHITGRIGLIESGSGLVVGEATIHGSEWPLNSHTIPKYQHLHQVEDHSLLEKWKYPWVLSDVVKYENPRPYRHPKGAVTWVRLDS